MLTLDSEIKVPDSVMFTSVAGDVVLLNTLSNTYYSLDNVGARFWYLLNDGITLRDAFRILIDEYDVASSVLEQDLLELLTDLVNNGLVKVVKPEN